MTTQFWRDENGVLHGQHVSVRVPDLFKTPTPLEEIHGQQIARRALEVAASGEHSVLLWGPRGAGKRTLANAFGALVRNRVEIMDSCACGEYQSIIRECTCNPRTLDRWRLRFLRQAAKADIVLEVPHVPVKELARLPQGDSYNTVAARVVSARAEASMLAELPKAPAMDDSAERVMEMAARRMGFSAGTYLRVMAVGRTIATMGRSRTVRGKDIAEAVQYNCVRAFYRDVV